MIVLTRLNSRVIVLNAEHIKMIESTPDTLITLVNGDTMMVKDSLDDVVEKAIEYQRRVHGFSVRPLEEGSEGARE